MRARKRKPLRRAWARAVLGAARILANAEARLARRRRSKSREVIAPRHEVARLETENDLLRARLRKVPGRRRPRYTSWQRLRILWHRSRYGLSLRKTSRVFVLGKGTLRRWLDDIDRARKRVVGGRCAVNRLPDLVREIAAILRFDQPSWGTRRIAHVLARLGLNVSRTSVQRIVRRKPTRRPPNTAPPTTGRRYPGIRPKRLHHIWFVDLTTVKTCFGFRSFRVAAILDAFSRAIVAMKKFADEPSAREMTRLLRRGIESAGAAPSHVITDQGKQFTAKRFRRFVRRRGIHQRFGAVRSSPSIAVVERFWRSMKEELCGALRHLVGGRSVDVAIRAWARWYRAERPHQGLGGQTPNETAGARHAPRRRRMHGDHWRLERRDLDGQPHLPVYRLRRAA